MFAPRVWKGQGDTANGKLARRCLGAGVFEEGFSTLSAPYAVSPPLTILSQTSVQFRTFSPVHGRYYAKEINSV